MKLRVHGNYRERLQASWRAVRGRVRASATLTVSADPLEQSLEPESGRGCGVDTLAELAVENEPLAPPDLVAI